jgi:hypothetical protein
LRQKRGRVRVRSLQKLLCGRACRGAKGGRVEAAASRWKCEGESANRRGPRPCRRLRRLDSPVARSCNEPATALDLSLYIARFCLISLPCLYVRCGLPSSCKHASTRHPSEAHASTPPPPPPPSCPAIRTHNTHCSPACACLS